MAEYILTTPTVINIGSAIPFNQTVCKSGCNIRHRCGSGIVKVKGGTCCNPRRYYVQFHGNVTNVAGGMQLGIYLDGELLPETLMSVVAGATTNVLSVDSATEICSEGCCEAISVRVVAATAPATAVTVNTAALIVEERRTA